MRHQTRNCHCLMKMEFPFSVWQWMSLLCPGRKCFRLWVKLRCFGVFVNLPDPELRKQCETLRLGWQPGLRANEMSRIQYRHSHFSSLFTQQKKAANIP